MKRFITLFLCVLVLSACTITAFADDTSAAVSEDAPAAVSEWSADDSSIYNELRSSIIHYLFGDDMSNVPFGTGWVDLVCTVLTFIVFLVPFFVVLWITRKICG